MLSVLPITNNLRYNVYSRLKVIWEDRRNSRRFWFYTALKAFGAFNWMLKSRGQYSYDFYWIEILNRKSVV